LIFKRLNIPIKIAIIHTKAKNAIKYSKNSAIAVFTESLKRSKTIAGMEWKAALSH
jgi:hypothetical protein